MTLSFSTHISGWPTLFTNKIVKGLWKMYSKEMNEWALNSPPPPSSVFNYLSIAEQEKIIPKIHTIRRDSKNRWREKMNIHFVINNRTKDRFQFAPILKVKKIQTFELKYLSVTKEPIDLKPIIWIDGYVFYDPATGIDKGIKNLAISDGFDSVDDFFTWFKEDFTGKIIHWTDLSY